MLAFSFLGVIKKFIAASASAMFLLALVQVYVFKELFVLYAHSKILWLIWFDYVSVKFEDANHNAKVVFN